jgi:hypothetical protein
MESKKEEKIRFESDSRDYKNDRVADVSGLNPSSCGP